MNDEEKLNQINKIAIKKLNDIMEMIDENPSSIEVLIAEGYATMIVLSVFGYNLESIKNDAEAAADRMIAMLGDIDDEKIDKSDESV
jgi:hypothetical protein